MADADCVERRIDVAFVGGTLCTTAPPNNPMRIVYEKLFACGPPGDGDWDAPAFLFAIGAVPRAFTKLGQGGAAVINAQGGLSWQAVSPRRHDFYVHIADQATLDSAHRAPAPARLSRAFVLVAIRGERC